MSSQGRKRGSRFAWRGRIDAGWWWSVVSGRGWDFAEYAVEKLRQFVIDSGSFAGGRRSTNSRAAPWLRHAPYYPAPKVPARAAAETASPIAVAIIIWRGHFYGCKGSIDLMYFCAWVCSSGGIHLRMRYWGCVNMIHHSITEDTNNCQVPTKCSASVLDTTCTLSLAQETPLTSRETTDAPLPRRDGAPSPRQQQRCMRMLARTGPP